MQSLIYLSLLVVICGLISGCQIAPEINPQIPESQPSVANTPTIQVIPTTQNLNSSEDKNVDTPLLANCVSPNDSVVLPSMTYEELPEGILIFLNNGGGVNQLDAELYESGYLAQPVGILPGDINTDQRTDLAVLVINPYSPLVPPDGKLMVYVCRDGSYELFEPVTNSDLNQNSPILKYFQDLNSDTGDELVVSYSFCGATTCFEAPMIYGWRDNRVKDILDSSEMFSSPEISLEGPDPEGFYAIKVTSGGFSSAGAGPQRSEIISYAYSPETQSWNLFARSNGKSNYRIHRLHDADNLARQEKFPDALLLYQQVISSSGLQDWVDPEVEQNTLSAYARFKMIVIYTMTGKEDLANAAIDAFESSTPVDSQEFVYLELARIFRMASSTDDWGEACNEVIRYIANHEDEVLKPLGSEQFGYGNPDYTAEDICPWK